MGSVYNESTIQVLEGLEAVRKRPSMYIGSVGTKGLHHLVYEVVDNSIDEALAGVCTEIYVCINSNGSVTIEDNGRGIPTGIHPQTGKSTLETILTVLHAGGKFGEGGYKVSGGLHGVGASVVNALSSSFDVVVKRDGKIFNQKYSKGKTLGDIRVIGEVSKDITGTSITFMPDNEIFDTIEFNYNTLESRLKELAFLTKGIKITFEDKRDKKQQTKVFQYDGGISEYVKHLNKENTCLHDVLYIQKDLDDMIIEVAIQYTNDYTENIYSFANNISTHDGGTHVAGFKNGITRTFNSYAREVGLLKDKDSNFLGEDVREGLTAIISIKLQNPQFEGQTKAKLGNGEVRNIVDTTVTDWIYAYLKENVDIAEKLIKKMIRAQQIRESIKNSKELARRKSELENFPLSAKLAECTSKKPEECEIFLVEGDSAGGSAKQGRDRKFQSILPLKGKIMNVERQTLERVLSSDEIKAMISSFKCGVGKDFDISKLRYNKIIIMTDADSDGNHIRTLILTFFYRYMKELIENGHVYVAQPPLYKITTGKNVKYARSDKELENILRSIKKNDVTIQRYKGLGEMDAMQLWETTMNPSTRTLMKVNIDSDMIANETFTTLMGSKVEPRKDFIQENAKYAKNVDV